MMNRLLTRFLLIFSTLIVSFPAHSEVVLLIHGYLSNSSVWLHSGVINTLESDGWKHGGMYSVHPNGQVFLNTNNLSEKENRQLMILDLPSEAPLLQQSDLIANVVNAIGERLPEQQLTLVGHSAGGLAARTALVRHDLKNVARLISIASPHLGTDMAEKALDISSLSGPATMLPDMFGGGLARTAQRSQHLYADLSRPRLGNLLDWLNKQPHPDIKWDSIVHTGINNSGYDSFVAAYSQDMNQILALRGKSTVLPLQVEHGLNPTDAIVLKKLLNDKDKS